MSNSIQSELQQLVQNVQKLTSANASAEALLKGLHDQLDTVASNLQASGIEAADLQELHDLNAQIAARTSELASAITANTPAAGNGGGATGATGGATGPANAASAVPSDQDKSGTTGATGGPSSPQQSG